MNREDVKKAADALGRLEALDAAWSELESLPHEALPISFPSAPLQSDGREQEPGIEVAGIQAFYPLATSTGRSSPS